MTSAELLVDAFGRIRQVVHRVVAGLTPEQLAFRAVCPASDDVSDIFQPSGSLSVTAVGRGAVADLRRQRQAAVAAAGAAVLVTTTASSASTLQGISHARTARNATGHELLTAGSAPMPVASPPRGHRGGLRVGRCRLARVLGEQGLPAEREGAAHQRPMPADRPVASDLEVSPAKLVSADLVRRRSAGCCRTKSSETGHPLSH